jgi:translocator protein
MARSASFFMGLLAFLALSFGAAWFGSRFQPGAWYAALEKPAWNPPAWIFGPVWTVLYILIAVSGHMLWRRRGERAARIALGWWAAQLVLNALWSWIFFGLQRPGLAFAEICVLLSAILVTTALAWRVRPLAGALLVPYLAWVAFAALLNFTLWRLNA